MRELLPLRSRRARRTSLGDPAEPSEAASRQSHVSVSQSTGKGGTKPLYDDSASSPQSLARYTARAAIPSALIMTPLLGLPFHSDQRMIQYWLIGEFAGNPLLVAQQTIAEVEKFISVGNFRPLGRFIMYMEQSAAFETALATGIPPHVINGLLRMIGVAFLAFSATVLISALGRSALARTSTIDDMSTPLQDNDAARLQASPSLVAMFPLLMASMLIVSGALHPISFFPLHFALVAIALIVIPLYIASDKALNESGLSLKDAALAALLGLVAATTLELLYLLPLTCLYMIIVRGWLANLSSRAIWKSSSVARFVVFGIAFLAVFIPSRIVIAYQCSRNECYGNTKADLSNFSFEQWWGRTLSGLPWDGWVLILRGRVSEAFAPRGPQGIFSNAWLVVVVGILVTSAIIASKNSFSRADGRVPTSQLRNIGLSVIGLGLIFTICPALMVSLSEGLQNWRVRGLGLDQWRDTLLVQVGWAFLVYGAFCILVSLASGRVYVAGHHKRWVVAAAALVLIVMTSTALAANVRYAQYRRSQSVGNVVNFISQSTIDFDNSDSGQLIRCTLLEDYSQFVCDDCWHSGERVAEELNKLSRSIHGENYCSVSDGSPVGDESRDGSGRN